MKFQDSDTIIPSVLLLDDEHQIHSAVKLRLGDGYRLLSVFSPKEALALIAHEQVDLCIVDVQMAEMDGLAFIEAAKKVDPALGYVIFSGFDSDENLRRAIPLQVFDFLTNHCPTEIVLSAHSRGGSRALAPAAAKCNSSRMRP